MTASGLYWEICADICIISVHERLSNLMTTTQQRQFSSWCQIVALLLLYPVVAVINAYLLQNKFVPNLYKNSTICAYSYVFELLDFASFQLVVIQ